MVLHLDSLPVVSKSLTVPPLEELASILNEGLQDHFSEVTVEVVDCPDLTQEPFGLAAKGLSGKASLVEFGGPAYLLPLVNREKVYDLKHVAKVAEINPAFIIGAGAGPFKQENVNCEAMFNLFLNNNIVNQQSMLSKVNLVDGSCILKKWHPLVTEFGILGNFFVSEGNPGKVLKVRTVKRTGTIDFIASIRTTLEGHYGSSNIIGLGGTFIMRKGKGKFHIMPDFSSIPLKDDTHLNNWLKFYDMTSPLIALGTFTTGEYDLDLRVQHFHAFSDHNEGGHYHIDTTPDVVEYEGYFNTAEMVYRIDAPPCAVQFGKD